MRKIGRIVSAVAACVLMLCVVQPEFAGAEPGMKDVTIRSDRVVTGFAHPESVAFEPNEKVFYVSQFGSVLNPTLKDGMGKISKFSVSGKILKEQYLPAPGDVLNKPKGLWIQSGRLWVTDIDVVWVFDLSTRKGRMVSLPGARFANDTAVVEGVLFVSDSGAKRIYRVEPADFSSPEVQPVVSVYGTALSFSPNGLYPADEGALFVAGYDNGGQDYGVYLIEDEESFATVIKRVGKLDGLAHRADGSMLMTDWKSRSLLYWHPKGGLKTLATGFQGPADFCVVPEDGGFLVVVPDLVKNEVRFIRFKE